MENKGTKYTRLNLEYLDYTGEDFVLLDKYRKIEQELGCPIEVVFKALKNGIYLFDNYYKEQLNYIQSPRLNGSNIEGGYKPYSRELKDYKKTWWLKEDRSE